MAGFLNQYEIFYSKARADLSAAHILYDKFMEGNSYLDIEVIFFHLQQSAEKLMKAVLAKKQIDFPRIHDLEALFGLLTKNNIHLGTNSDLLIELNDFAVEGRYAFLNEGFDNVKEFFVLVSDMALEVNKIINEK
jgi:HEPN domain-containing protein